MKTSQEILFQVVCLSVQTIWGDSAWYLVSIVQHHNKMLCTACTAFTLTCIERPPGPPYERQFTLVENRVQDVRGVSVSVCPECWLPIRCFGALQHMHE